MSKESAEYEIKLRDAFSGPLSALEKQMNGFESKLNGINKLAAGFGVAFGVSEGIQAITALTTKIISLGAGMEQTKISFETMLGSADRADKVLKQLVKFAEITPFRQDEVIQGSKQLLAYGFAAENLTDDLRRLGDVSAGLNIPLGDLVYLYGTIRTQGKAMTKDLMQFANRGIPIYTELTKVTGKSGAALQAMVEDGQIGFDVIEKAFKNMTKEGSMFGGLMEKLSQSLSGKWSTFLDKLEVMGTKMGTKMIPDLKAILESVTSMVDMIPHLNFDPIAASVSQLKTEILTLNAAFDELQTAVFGSMDKVSKLDIVFRYLSILFHNLSLPIRLLVLAFTNMVNVMKSSIGVIEGVGRVLIGTFTRDFAQVAKGINQVSAAWDQFVKDSSSDVGAFMHGEKQFWSKAFDPLSKAPDKGGNAYAGGVDTGSKSGTTMSAADKAKAAGVEKIQSGTRNITINITKLIETVKFETTNGNSQAQLMDMIKRTLITAVNDANIVAQ